MSITIISQPEKEKLYTQVFHLLGMPVRGIELTEEQMDTFMELSVSEYEQYVSDWLIESQWSGLVGLDLDTQSLTRAFTTRSLDYETQYSHSGGVGGFAQMGTSGSYFMLPAHDLLLRMQDRNLKNRLIGGDVTYRITAGPNGTKVVHLYNVPGGKFDFSNLRNNFRVWYWYYDTMDRDTCLEQNSDVVKLPSDIDVTPLTWDALNKPAQNWVRKYLIAYSKEGLARIWGKFSGDLQVPDSTVKLDYSSLLTEAKDERLKLVEELMQRLERLRPEKVLERKGLEAENLNKALKFRPMVSPFNVI